MNCTTPGCDEESDGHVTETGPACEKHWREWYWVMTHPQTPRVWAEAEAAYRANG